MPPSQQDQAATADSPKAMTVLGPADDLEVVLMNEPLICDPRKRPLQCGGVLSWDDLARIRQDPFQSAANMTLSSTNDALIELTKAQHAFNTILNTTSVAMGRDPAASKILSERLQKHIILGTTPAAENTHINNSTQISITASFDNEIEASKEDMDRMEQELLYGYEDEVTKQLVRAGFIGELQVSDPMTSSELRQLKACAVVQSTTKAPLFLAAPGAQLSTVLDQLEVCGSDLSKTVLTHMDLYARHNIPLLVQQVLDRGVNICFDQFSVSSAIWDLDHEYPSRKEVVEMIHSLLQHNPAYITRIFLSSGVNMKLQYIRYGGMGYGAVTDHLVPQLLQKGLTQAQINAMISENPRRLLCWWTSPPPKKLQKEYLPCSVCRRMFEPILGEYYTKYTFTYCDTKCLRKHRKMGFKELD